MKTQFLLAVCLTAVVPACDDGRMHNAGLMKQYAAKLREVSDILAEVKDVPSARAAKPRLATVMAEVDKINERLEESYNPEDVVPADAPAVTKHVAQGIEQMQRLIAETVRIGQQPELREALGDVWLRLPGAPLIEAQGLPSGQP